MLSWSKLYMVVMLIKHFECRLVLSPGSTRRATLPGTPDNRVAAIHDLEINDKRAGTGRAVVESIGKCRRPCQNRGHRSQRRNVLGQNGSRICRPIRKRRNRLGQLPKAKPGSSTAHRWTL